jgi:hypothetical protein
MSYFFTPLNRMMRGVVFWTAIRTKSTGSGGIGSGRSHRGGAASRGVEPVRDLGDGASLRLDVGQLDPVGPEGDDPALLPIGRDSGRFPRSAPEGSRLLDRSK